MRYATPGALRAALEARLQSQGLAAAVDFDRLRRRAVFERLLIRLEHAMPGQWVLKGGMALELRLGGRARTTRDLDLVLRQRAEPEESGEPYHGESVRERLIEALADDPERDGFEFRIGAARAIDVDEAGRPGRRLPVDARLDGRTFAAVRLDVVARAEEISATDRVRLHSVLAFAGFPDHEVEAVDPAQHFAEKLHAYTRPYGERPNSRVKDLPDLVLLLDGGLAPSAELLATVEHVFAARATHELPADLPDPPADWAGRYATLAEELDLAAATVDEAMALLRRFWATTLQARERPGPGPGLGRDGPGDPGGPG
jgi:hypothetical protein